MQRPAQYGSSGEHDVFEATRYFDGLADLAAGPVTVRWPMHHQQESYRSTQELGAKTSNNLAAFFGSLVSSAASFRKNPPGVHDEPHQVSSSSCATACDHDLGVVVGDRRLQGVRVVRGANGDEERWVVTCGGHALEEQHHMVHEKIAGAKSSDDQQVEKAEDDHEKIIVDAKLSDGHQVEDGDGWGSDTSSDLFELDLDAVNNC
ncbi:hypothetical protein ACQJBY_053150 [Aegilops geniculata]